MSPTRKKRTASQTVASIAILLVLAGIAAVIVLEHSRAACSRVSVIQSEIGGIFTSLPEGVTPAGDLERFEADTLYEKINGKAELYISSGFKELKCRRFKAAGGQVEVFVYDMGEAKNAYAVYLAQKRKKATELDLPDAAYLTANALYLRRGGYYVEIVSSEIGEAITQVMVDIAGRFVEATPTAGETVDDKQLFVAEDLDEGNMTFITKEAFGFAKLDAVLMAGYKIADTSAVAYVSRRASEEEASSLVNEYAEFLLAMGFEKADPPDGLSNCRMVELDGNYEIVFSVGKVLAGVRECEDRTAAEKLARSLHKHIMEVGQ